MKKTIEFIYDFGSPNAYLAYKLLPDIAANLNAAVTLNPCLLGGIFKATNNQSPFYAYAPIKGKLAYEQLEMKRFIEKHDIPFEFNPNFPINTLLIMRGAMVAKRDGILDGYTDAVFDLMWKQPRKMDDPEIVKTALTEAGFDGAAIVDATKDPAIKSTLISETEAVVERGVFGMPTFFVGEEMFYGKDRLDQVAEAVSRG
ncbi:2-hydroxychromene-2-carboxylate isomerase [Hyphococcus lacteus]|uniref:2-hydroxychromene-2-carboxylate isomerase n=1 Tax=Hyphococcus lacteus TaxID=3143536 RepID=A0ABV3Z3X1_9PROT